MIDVGVAQAGEDRQRDEPSPLAEGDGELFLAVPVPLGVEGLHMQGAPVDAGPDPAGRERANELVAARRQVVEAEPERVEMPGVLAVRALARNLDLLEIGEGPAGAGPRRPPRGPGKRRPRGASRTRRGPATPPPFVCQ